MSYDVLSRSRLTPRATTPVKSSEDCFGQMDNRMLMASGRTWPLTSPRDV